VSCSSHHHPWWLHYKVVIWIFRDEGWRLIGLERRERNFNFENNFVYCIFPALPT
jgi:hypothetical protein